MSQNLSSVSNWFSSQLHQIWSSRRRASAIVIAAAFVFGSVLPAAQPAKAAPRPSPARPQNASAASHCNLNSAHGDIQHVIYIQFDNVHFTRDNPTVPSDLEQMPHLLNFLTQNGTFSDNHHTPLIAHTSDDIITSLTGVYGERHGQPVGNSYNYFNPNASDGLGSSFTTSFTYWTDIVDPSTPSADSTFSLLTQTGTNAPAPWVPFTRAGCNVGAVSIANMEIENTGNDIITVFGAGSPEAIEAATPHSPAVADFEGIAIHCAAGDAVCAAGNSKPDVLPQEPGGYAGFSALFGHKYVVPVIAPSGLNDLNGNPITGFPGFGGISAAQALAYTATMQENGVPVTYSYISDAHDSHTFPFVAFGPGQAGYVKQLAAYDDAFNKFFNRLANDGITPKNTLFIVTADENDHFAGGPPTNPGCDGVTTPCMYTAGTSGPNTIGEILTNIQFLLAQEDPILNTPFDIHFDMAPVFYISGQPGRDTAVVRQFEHDAANLTAVNPRTGNTDTLTRYLADPVELKLLHMITADPLRTPSFVMFGNPDYFFQTFVPNGAPEVGVNPSFAWNHGGVAPEINNTWLGLVGPGVQNKGVDGGVWSDHTDIRPTLLSLVGLTDDYQSEGRVLAEDLQSWALPNGVANSSDEFVELASAYKRITAPVGELGLASLKISTKAIAGDEATYNRLENQLSFITDLRNHIAGQMLDALTAAEFQGKHITEIQERELVLEATALTDFVNWLAAQ